MIRIKGTRFGVDKRGLLTGNATYLCDGLSEAVSGTLPNPFGSGQFVGRSGGEWDTGEEKWVVQGNFEGVVFEPGPESEDYSLDAEFSEEPIEAHPSITTLMERYQGTKGDDGRVQFAELITGQSGGGSGLSNNRQRTEKNPFFGVQSYPAMRMVAQHSYVRRSVPNSIYRKVGTVLNSLPAGFDEPGGRKWVVMPPLARRRGDGWEITERYKDVGDDPHVEILSQLVRRV
jgi:hypothetical protein